jgi:hypothetical protein
VKNSVFKKIDDFIFKQIDQFKASPNAQKISDLTSSLGETEQKIVNKVLTFGLLLLPLGIVVSFYLGNKEIKEQIEVKSNILFEMEQFTRGNNNIGMQSARIVSTFPMSNQAEFENRMRQMLGQRSINGTKVSFTNFIPDERQVSLKESQGSLSFKEFTMADLTGLLSGLIVNERVKVSKLNISKNNSTELLNGELDFLHFSRSSSRDAEATND